MKTKLIGYKISIGEMDDESNPKNKISYNSRTIRFITDMGETSDNIGFDMFDSKFNAPVYGQLKCVGFAPVTK